MRKVEREFELKLGMAEAALKQFREKPILRDIGIGRPETRKLRSVYYDTSSRRLMNAGYSLRIRRERGKWLQTLKGLPVESETGLTRFEYEVEVEEAAPDMDRIKPGHFRKKVKALLDGKPLEPVFETRIWRTTRLLGAPGKSKIELAVDTGEIRKQDRAVPISEIELELKSGEPHAVFAVAKDILHGEPFQLIRHSKAARGYRLTDDATLPHARPSKSEPVILSADQTAGEAFLTIVRSCARQVLTNLEATMQSDDPEGPHQLRIGLRRLRGALRAHRNILDRKFAGDLDRSARALARLVGGLRDIDVLIDEFVRPYASDHGNGTATQALLDSLFVHRDKTRQAVRDGVLTGDYSELQLDMIGFLEAEGSDRLKNSDVAKAWGQSVIESACESLDRSWVKVANFGHQIDKLSVAERHEMRKALKNHRYTVEYYSSLYSKKAVRRHVERLRKLQSDFGYLNDVAMVHKIRDIYESGPDPQGDVLWTIGHLQGHHDARAESSWQAAKIDWRILDSGVRFWEAQSQRQKRSQKTVPPM